MKVTFKSEIEESSIEINYVDYKRIEFENLTIEFEQDGESYDLFIENIELRENEDSFETELYNYDECTIGENGEVNCFTFNRNQLEYIIRNIEDLKIGDSVDLKFEKI